MLTPAIKISMKSQSFAVSKVLQSSAASQSICLGKRKSKRLALTLMTDKDPIREQMARYTKMLLLPCFGATEKIKYRITPIAVMQYRAGILHGKQPLGRRDSGIR